MISYKNSIKVLKNAKIIIKNELINSSDCINRIAAENIYSKINNPEGDNAAFDGYAINSKDTERFDKKKGKFFKIIGTIAAGDEPLKKRRQKFQAIEIMTGGLLPKGFDTIIPIEQIVFHPNQKKGVQIQKQ